MNYSDDQEEKEEASTAAAAEVPANGEADNYDKKEARPKSPPTLPRKETEESKSEASTADETTVSVEPPVFVPQPPPQTLERTISYKEAMFEKAIGADVVSMSDLRRLGWNGIPVRVTIVVMIHCFAFH